MTFGETEPTYLQALDELLETRKRRKEETRKKGTENFNIKLNEYSMFFRIYVVKVSVTAQKLLGMMCQENVLGEKNME